MTRKEASSTLFEAAYNVIELGEHENVLERNALAFALVYFKERNIIDDQTMLALVAKIEEDDALYSPEQEP